MSPAFIYLGMLFCAILLLGFLGLRAAKAERAAIIKARAIREKHERERAVYLCKGQVTKSNSDNCSSK